MLHALVLTAQALPVSDRAKDARAEQAIALRLEGAGIDGLWLGDFTMRPAPDLFRRSHTDLDGIEIRYCVSEVERARTIQGVLLLPFMLLIFCAVAVGASASASDIQIPNRAKQV